MSTLERDGAYFIDEGGPFIDASLTEETVDKIVASDKDRQWRKGEVVQIGDQRWQPGAVAALNDRTDILHVHLNGDLPRFVTRRLYSAYAQGIGIFIGISLGALHNYAILEVLASVEAQVIVVDTGELRTRPSHLLAAMSDYGISVPPDVRTTLGAEIWSKIESGSSHEKGRRFEALLAFLFSQVQDIRVIERNYRTATQEIDLVLQIDNYSDRVWQQPGVPFILVEAKNTSERSGQPIVSLLIHKLRTKRRRARIGIAVSIAGFTADAKLETLRISESEECIVLVDRQMVWELISASDINGTLERYVRRAMLE